MEEKPCYKWGHPHVASLSWSHRLWNNSDDVAFYLCQHLVLSTAFWGAKHYFHFPYKNGGLGKWAPRTTQTVAEPRSACRDSDSKSLHHPTLFDRPGPPYVLWSGFNRVWLPLQAWRSCPLEPRSSRTLGFCFHRCRGQVSEKNIPTLTPPDDPTGESLLPEGEFHEEGENLKPHLPSGLAWLCGTGGPCGASQLSLAEFCWLCILCRVQPY